MHRHPAPEEILNFEGKENETLFWHLKSWLMVGRQDDLQRQIDAIWEQYGEIEDERLLAIVGALCVEGAIDGMLEGYVAGYNDLQEDTDVTFSLKTKVARALHLIPRHILNSCDLVRRIRNDFAHNLDLTTFGQLPDKHLNKLGPYVREYNTKERNWENWPDLYRELVSFSTLGLAAYSFQLQAVREYLETEDFRRHLKAFVEGDAGN